jgi:hypothetical protein
MNPWLVTWEPASNRAKNSVPNRIAAILPNQTSAEDVKRVLYLLLANYHACSGLSNSVYVSEQIRFAKREYPYKAVDLGFDRISCGGNPSLHARRVYDLKLMEQEGHQILQWEEPIYPILNQSEDPYEQAKKKRPFPRRMLRYYSRDNAVVLHIAQQSG